MVSRYYGFVSRYYELSSYYYELVSRYYELACRNYELVSRNYHLVSRYYELVSRYYALNNWPLIISLQYAHASILQGNNQGPVVQSIVCLTSLLRGRLVKCFMTV